MTSGTTLRGVIDVGLCVSTAQFRIVPVPSFVIDCPGNVSQSIAGGDSVSTVVAVYGGVNKLESSIFPSLHHRKGWPSESQNIAKLPLIARPGWFSDRKPKGKPPRLRLLRWLRNILLTTQPPLLAVMQGGEWRSTVIHSQL